MKRVLVIGGGLSGLSAAAFLSNNKFEVTLIEATHKLGGKTYSFFEEQLRTEIDNGQHILLGCYSETLNFLKLISAINTIEVQKYFSINYLSKRFQVTTLKSKNNFYPFNLLGGLISFSLFNVNDKISLIKLLLKIRFIDSDNLSQISVKEWLTKEKQSKKVNSLFWNVICVGALNTSTEIASAKMFCDILKQIFWTNDVSYKIILPKNSLNETFIKSAETFLLKNKTQIFKSEKCERIILNNGKVDKIITNKREISNFDYYLFALPFYALNSFNILDTKSIDIKYSPILNVYIWLRNNPLKEPFYALEDSLIHWIFNKNNFINITISNALSLITKSKSEIESLIINELDNFIPELSKEVEQILIIKEKKATFIPSNEILDKRPSSKTEISNLFLAGDWTDTKLPSTIESAVKSGRIAAEEIIKHHYNEFSNNA